MISPIDYLQKRLTEMQGEYERVLNIPYGGYQMSEAFMLDAHNDLYKIEKSMQEFRDAIKVLQE